MFDIRNLILKKKNHQPYNSSELEFIVKSYLTGHINNDDMTSWLKTIFNYGMGIDETVHYTKSIINSGQKIKFNDISKKLLMLLKNEEFNKYKRFEPKNISQII